MTNPIPQAAIEAGAKARAEARGTDWENLKHTFPGMAKNIQPTRTVPTRDEIAEAVMARDEIDVDYLDRDSALRYADAVLALLADQPTVAEVQEQWANYITNTTGSVGNNLTLENLVKALRAPHPPFGGPHKNEDQK